MTVKNNDITPDVEDFVPFVGYPNSPEYKNRWAGGEPVVRHYNFKYDDTELERSTIVENLIDVHGARFIAFEFTYFGNKELDDSQSSAFNNFLDYIHNPKTDTEDCFDPSRIFFHKIVRNKFILGKSRLSGCSPCFNSISLIEFLYITVDPEFTRKVKPNAIKFKGFFAIRSLVGQENDRPVLRASSLVLKWRWAVDVLTWELKGVNSINAYWDFLMSPAINNPKEGLAHTAAFHAFHWFGNYNEGADNQPIYADLLSWVDWSYDQSGPTGILPVAYTSHRPRWDPLLIKHYGPYPEDMKNNNKEIPGVYVDNSYGSPALLLHFIRVYILLNKIRLVNGIWYEPINDRFLCPLGSNDWFEQNIYEILDFLWWRCCVSWLGLDISRLVSTQLDNAMKLINLNPKFLLLPI